jgi:hypothetical protein
VKEKINQLEDIVIETIQNEMRREKMIQKYTPKQILNNINSF